MMNVEDTTQIKLSQIKFKITMIKSSLCSCGGAYLPVKGTIASGRAGANAAARQADDRKKTFKNCALFTECISEINNSQVDNVEDLDAAMSIYSLLEYSNHYAKTSGSLW